MMAKFFCPICGYVEEPCGCVEDDEMLMVTDGEVRIGMSSIIEEGYYG